MLAGNTDNTVSAHSSAAAATRSYQRRKELKTKYTSTQKQYSHGFQTFVKTTC